MHVRVLRQITFFILLFASMAQRAGAAPSKKVNADLKRFQKEFVTDEYVRKQVRFWEAIFQKYDASSIVIHDMDEPLAMIDVINFDKYTLADGSVTSIESSNQSDLVRRYIDRYNLAAERFKQQKDKAIAFGPIEKRLFDVYKRDPLMLEKLYRGDIKLRGQAGLANTFLNAAQKAQEYFPYMEDVFRKQGLSIYLTRLPFVESMFNLAAKSKVGASGIWQFMPDTAREYMSVNAVVDERNNPYKATMAAAQLMQTNFKELGAWPLAVTAYNHGRGGMARASREIGTMSLGKIITTYKSPSFGFASKNFYAEFVAAANSYDALVASGRLKPLQKKQPQIENLVLAKQMTIKELSSKGRLSFNELSSLNPCLNSAAFTSKSSTPLPANYVVRVPKNSAKELKKLRLATNAYPLLPTNRISRR